MRSIFLVTCLLFYILSSGQSRLDFNSSSNFIQKEILALNLKLYDAAKLGKITAYTNDSLQSAFIPDSLSTRLSVEALVQNGDDDYIVVKHFNPVEEFIGQRLLFKPDFDYTTGTVAFKLYAISCVRTLTINGLEFPQGVNAFTVSTRDFPKVFTADEIVFINALSMQRSAIGDFFNPSYYYESSNKDIAYNTICQEVHGASYHLNMTQKSDSLLGLYQLGLVTAMAVKNMETNGAFYKDLALKIPYNDLGSDLQYDMQFLVLDPNNLGDEEPYPQSFALDFRFDHDLDCNITKKDDDYLVDLIVRRVQGDEHIYYAYNTLKHFIPKHDQIVLESLMSYLVE